MTTADPVTAAIVIGGAVATAGVTAGVSALTRPDAPKVPKPPRPDPKLAERMAFGAADRQRRRAAGAFGRSDTVLTGALGVPGGGATGGAKSLLGL